MLASRGEVVKRDYPKLVMLGVLHMAQYFPAAFTGVALPFIFRQQGLPLEMFWLLALPGIPRWLKWLIALVVDNYGSARIGYRKTWIVPCTIIGASTYLSLAFIPPEVSAVYLIVSILLFKSFVMAAQDIAVDGYAAESMTDIERPVGTSIIIFLAILAGVMGSGVVALVETFGWPITMVCASLLMIGAAMPAIIRKEPPPPLASQRRRERGERPNLLKALARPESLLILPYLFAFGFGGTFFGSMVGPFFADKGMTLTEFGIISPISVIAGAGLGALATPMLVSRLGMKTTALISLMILPAEAAVYYLFARMEGLPVMWLLITTVALLGFGTSIYTYVVNNSRFRWVSKSQAGTDYSMQSSLWNLGVWAAGSASGFVAGFVGWSLFFPIAASVTFIFGMFYVTMFDRIENMVLAREDAEVDQTHEANEPFANT